MPRTLPEWIGSSPDTQPPPRVKLRVFDRHGGRCQCGCRRKIAAGEAWQCDHIIALINGGENRESNFHPLLLAHHIDKTIADVAEKTRVAARRIRHLGLAESTRPMPCGKRSGYKKTMRGQVVARQSQAEMHRETMRRRKIGEDT